MKTQAICLSLLMSIAFTASAEDIVKPSAGNQAVTVEKTLQQSSINPVETDFEKFIVVEKSKIDLSSGLRKMYDGYKVKITSTYPQPLSIKNTSLSNGVPGLTAYKTLYVSPWKSLPWAFIPFVGIIPALSLNAMYTTTDIKMLKESKLYPGKISNTEISSNEPIQFNLLVPAGQTPIMAIEFQDKGISKEFIFRSL